MADQNEFEVDSPEIYQNQEALNEDISQEAPAAEVQAPVVGVDPAVPGADVTVEPQQTAPEVTQEAPQEQVAPAPAVAPEISADQATREEKIGGLDEKAYLTVDGKALATKQKLAKEEKVTMMIPFDPGEKPGAYRTVIINGYRFDVKKNTMVALPKSVAKLLQDAYRITSEVVENNPTNLDRADAEKRKALGV